MGQTQLPKHRCGYAFVREEVIDSVDVGSGLHLPSELRATLRRDQYTERCSLPVGTLLSWYDGSLDMEETELAKLEVKQCPQEVSLRKLSPAAK
jgi:hypothetical protein